MSGMYDKDEMVDNLPPSSLNCPWCGHDKHIGECGFEEMDNVDAAPLGTCLCGQNNIEESLAELHRINTSFQLDLLMQSPVFAASRRRKPLPLTGVYQALESFVISATRKG